jgi:chemotaxis-related protein WspB
MLFVLCQLGDEGYAIACRDVREILPRIAIRAIPHAPDGVAGVADYRGEVLPVVDLARIVSGRDAQSRLSTRLIVVNVADAQGETRALGLIAERVTSVTRCEPSDFHASGVHNGNAAYLGEMTRVHDRLVQRIDVARLLPASVRDALFPPAVNHGAQ